MYNKEIKFTMYKRKAKVDINAFKNLRKYFDKVIAIEKTYKWQTSDVYFKENNIDYYADTFTFNLFTNKGKLSKQDKHYKKDLAKEIIDMAEKVFSKELTRIKALEENTKKAQTRANYLANKINNSNFNVEEKDLNVLDSKISHSKWYKTRNAAGHMPSIYYRLLPKEVIKEGRELLKIRKENEDNKFFDFKASSYDYVLKREADHKNPKPILKSPRCRYVINDYLKD